MADETPGKPPKQRRGFAVMDPDRRREISGEGGRASHEQGTGHEFTHLQAVAAGRLGGLAKARRDRERKEST